MAYIDVTPAVRFGLVKMLQAAYPTFNSFLADATEFMYNGRYSVTRVQEDIADFLEGNDEFTDLTSIEEEFLNASDDTAYDLDEFDSYDETEDNPNRQWATDLGQLTPVVTSTCSRKMVMAQRGQAKTTITACYSVWRLIHNTREVVLVVSGRGDLATEISGFIIDIINTMPQLAPLAPKSGQRKSVKAFDIHKDLRGVLKPPSVSCVSVMAGFQGKRATILIADDIETAANADSPKDHERLKQRAADFHSVVKTGMILYLGTPQCGDSIYNDLPSKGFDVRIWTGRYPTPEQLSKYQGLLAPMLQSRLKHFPELGSGGGADGTEGRPTDPALSPEEFLQKSYEGMGAANYYMQFMLNTDLLDAEKYPLRLQHIIVGDVGDKSAAAVYSRSSSESQDFKPLGWALNTHLRKAYSSSDEKLPLGRRILAVDPSGGGATQDEFAYVVMDSCNGNYILQETGGFTGGTTEENSAALKAVILKWKPNTLVYEGNFGGDITKFYLRAIINAAKREAPDLTVGLKDSWSSTKKEARIIGTLEPVIKAGKLVVTEDAVLSDMHAYRKYPSQVQLHYSLFQQISKITQISGCLVHDDRIDCLALAVQTLKAEMLKHSPDAIAPSSTTAMDSFLASLTEGNRTNVKLNKSSTGGIQFSVGEGISRGKKRRNRTRRI